MWAYQVLETDRYYHKSRETDSESDGSGSNMEFMDMRPVDELDWDCCTDPACFGEEDEHVPSGSGLPTDSRIQHGDKDGGGTSTRHHRCPQWIRRRSKLAYIVIGLAVFQVFNVFLLLLYLSVPQRVDMLATAPFNDTGPPPVIRVLQQGPSKIQCLRRLNDSHLEPVLSPLRMRKRPLSLNDSMSPEEFLQEYQSYCQEVFIPKRIDGRKLTRPLCSCIPENLIGPLNISLARPAPRVMEKRFHPTMKLGGGWTPSDCTPRHRVAIIIPYRDRKRHLMTSLNHLHMVLQRQQLEYRIFVIEQGEQWTFNKASLMNVGFVEARSRGQFDCYVFHDVDVMTEDDRNFYTCADQPKHVAPYLLKFNYTLKYKMIFGAATAFTDEQFVKVNGFSNRYYGWGGEDDDMSQRVTSIGYKILRFPPSISRFQMIPHERDIGNPYNHKRLHKVMKDWYSHKTISRFHEEGLNSLRYRVTEVTYHCLYTHLLVEIPHLLDETKPYKFPKWKIEQDKKMLELNEARMKAYTTEAPEVTTMSNEKHGDVTKIKRGRS